MAPGAPVLISEDQRILRHNPNYPPVEAGVPVAKQDSCLLASTEGEVSDRDREDVMAVTGLGFMLILLIALPALLCIHAIRDLVKLAKHRRTIPVCLQENRPVFMRVQPISDLINEDV